MATNTPVCHFAIHADDCERALAFYRAVFGWRFVAWGPPGFWRIDTGQPGLEGALHGRHEPLSGAGMRGFECSISVADVESTCRSIERHGGQITQPPFLIEGVGSVARFTDPEGNAACAMQYLEDVVPGTFEAEP